jgi:hypothetical protein
MPVRSNRLYYHDSAIVGSSAVEKAINDRAACRYLVSCSHVDKVNTHSPRMIDLGGGFVQPSSNEPTRGNVVENPKKHCLKLIVFAF